MSAARTAVIIGIMFVSITENRKKGDAGRKGQKRGRGKKGRRREGMLRGDGCQCRDVSLSIEAGVPAVTALARSL